MHAQIEEIQRTKVQALNTQLVSLDALLNDVEQTQSQGEMDLRQGEMSAVRGVAFLREEIARHSAAQLAPPLLLDFGIHLDFDMDHAQEAINGFGILDGQWLILIIP